VVDDGPGIDGRHDRVFDAGYTTDSDSDEPSVNEREPFLYSPQ